MRDGVTKEWIRRLPKAEVHLHLEGCLPPEMVASAAARAGRPLDRQDDGPVGVESLAELLEHLDESCGLISEASQLEEVAFQICARARLSEALHVDVIFNPTHWPRWTGRLREMVGALDAGFRAGQLDHGVTALLCVSLKRDQSSSEAHQLLDTILDIGHARVGALSIDGNEAGGRHSHNERFAPVFSRAKSAGLRLCAHAGESSGPAGVAEAVELLGAERIDHGIRSLEDDDVTKLLADRQIPLGICPTSNVVLGVVGDMRSHPIKELREGGVACSINTDDPLLYGIDLAGEYGLMAGVFGWGRAELGEIAKVSIESSFADEDRIGELIKSLGAYLARND